MKLLIQICFLTILISSCGDDEITYPATFNFDSNQEIGTSIVTQDASGNLIEVDAINALNSPLCDVFAAIQVSEEISSITLLSETELEITIDFGSGNINTTMVPYTVQDDVIFEGLGLKFDGNDKIISKICNHYTFAPDKGLVEGISDFCVVQDHLEDVKNRFSTGGFTSGDTLGLCIVNKIYKLK